MPGARLGDRAIFRPRSAFLVGGQQNVIIQEFDKKNEGLSPMDAE